MEDKDFNELRLRMQIAPNMERWPDKYEHSAAMKKAVTEARSRVFKTYAQMDEIDKDANLTPQGKAQQRRKIAEQAIAAAKASKTLEGARDAVTRQCEKWAAKLGEIVKPAEDIATATTYVQIRNRVANMKEGRLAFLDKHAGDPVVASAVMSAPVFLSGLTDVEFAVVKRKVEQHFVSPEIIDARADTEKALADAEAGWARAQRLIEERGGIETETKRKVA